MNKPICATGPGCVQHREGALPNQAQIQKSIAGRTLTAAGLLSLVLAATNAHAAGVGITVDAATAAAAEAAGAWPTHLHPSRPGPNTSPELAHQFNRATHQALETPTTPAEPGAGRAETEPGSNAAVATPSQIWYPAQVSNPNGGPTIQAATQYNIYLGCSANNGSCWGSPATFESNLSYSGSGLIGVVNQYVGSTSSGRYPVSPNFCFNTTPVGNYLPYSGANSILSWLTSCFKSLGSHGGAGAIYHIFLNQGIDTCDSNGVCYSPDGKEPNFSFCGYHSYSNINGSRVYFTVEPYQAVAGCYGAGTNIVSATANVLSHEIFELISDPQFNAWHNYESSDNYGAEIGDECEWVLFNVKLSGTTYSIQLEYSNTYTACVGGT